MDQKTPRVEIAQDIDAIMRACWPFDFTTPAHAEPKLITGCMHPIEELKVTGMGTDGVVCSKCFTKMSPQAVSIRMDSYEKTQKLP